MAEPGFLRGCGWYKKPKVQGRGKKRVKQMKRAWWSVWRADERIVWMEREGMIWEVWAPGYMPGYAERIEAWKWVI